MVYVNIFSAGHLYSVLRVCPKNNYPEQQSETPLSVEKVPLGRSLQQSLNGLQWREDWGPTETLAKPTG